MKKFTTTALALTFSALALTLSACQTTPSSQVSVNANTAIDQAIRANSKASTQHTKQMATANKLNHISYANVAYDNINERQKMDIYLPKNHRGNAPVVLYIHGGGFIVGDKIEVMGGSHKNVEEMIKRLLDNGYAVVSVGYRFLPDALLDEISNDVTKAFEFVRKNGKQYGLDSNRIAVMGESAGGHLAQWLAVTQGKHIKASLPYYGSADFVNMTATTKAQPQCEDTNWANVIQADIPQDFDLSAYAVGEKYGSPAFIKKATALSPIYRVSKDTPPTLMFHGNNDCVVAHEQSVRYLKKLQEYQIPSELVIVEGEGHATPKFWTTPAYQEKVLAFLKQYL